MTSSRKLPAGVTYIVGVDEVGRGPLAGPVAVGAFAAPTNFNLGIFKGARDSKKMTAQKREECLKQIKIELKNKQIKCAVSFVSAGKIDRIGLTSAIKEALENSLKKLSLKPEDCLVLLDGALRAPSKYLHQKTIIKGDDKEKIISLASIVAKVTRDKKLIRMSKLYPLYNFHNHKGYGTKEHRRKIIEIGICPIHRQSFLRNILQAPNPKS